MTRNLEKQVSNLNSEIASLRKEKQYLEQSAGDLKRQIDDLNKESRQSMTEIQKYQIKEESLKSQLAQAHDRVQESREEIFQLKQDKEKLFSKLDHLLYENENLRSEVFMMKKMMLEMEKRDLRLASVPFASPSGKFSSDTYQREKSRLDMEIEAIRDRPEPSQRIERHKREEMAASLHDQRRTEYLNDTENQDSSYRPRNRLNSRGQTREDKNPPVTSVKEIAEVVDIYSQPAGYRNPLVASQQSGHKRTGVRVSTDVNKSSQEANILTWGNGEPARHRQTTQLQTNITLARGNQSLAVSSTGHLRRPSQDQANLNQSLNGLAPRFSSPQRSGGTLHESLDLGNRMSNNLLYDLDRMIVSDGTSSRLILFLILLLSSISLVLSVLFIDFDCSAS